MKKIKVMTIVGTRPEIIRLSRVMACLDKHLRHILVHTGQNYDYELNEVFFKDLEIKKPDYFLDAASRSRPVAEAIGRIMIKIDRVLAKETPDAVLILGDTNSSLAAIPVKRRKIPIFHMEAGNRCFDQRVPEEINRKIVDHISDINLPYSSIAREYLIREGFPADRIIKTGSPLCEVLNHYAPKIERSKIVQALRLKMHDYFVVSIHREENVDSEMNLAYVISVLNTVAKVFKKPIIMSTHPRTRMRLGQKGVRLHNHIKLIKPLGFSDYVCLQKKSFAVLSDSGTITEESSILNFPAVNVRETHERPEGMEEAAVIMTGLRAERVLQALSVLAGQPRGEQRLLKLAADYDVHNVSEKVLRIIIGYIDYVNRTVWHKQ